MSTVDVEQLLEELTQQRKDRVGISTIALNVIAFVENDEHLLDLMSERIDTLAERNVSRTVLLACDRREHSVRSNCNEIEDTLVTRSERIELAATDLSAAQSRSIVHDLLVPGVRSVLLWAGSHATDPRCGALADLADTVVLFSSAFDRGTGPLREILQLQSGDIKEKIRDLAYLRLLAWQDAIAQFFDDAQLAAELPRIARVEVVSGSAVEAYYLVGWLASRLSWNPCGQNELCNADGMKISMALRQQGNPRRVYGVRLHSPDCTFAAAVQDETEDLLCLTVEGRKNRPQRCMPIHDVDMVALIERAVFMMRSPQVYTQTLQMVERLLEQTGA